MDKEGFPFIPSPSPEKNAKITKIPKMNSRISVGELYSPAEQLSCLWEIVLFA